MLCLNMLVGSMRQSPGKRALYIATEDEPSKLIERVISNLASIEGRKLKMRKLSQDDVIKIRQTAEEVREIMSRVEFSYMLMPTMQDIQTRVLSSMNTGCDLAMFDWLDHKTVNTGQASEMQATTAIFSKLREMKGQSDLPLVAAVQMNRSWSHRSDPRPQMSDLAWSSAIEQVSDIILFIYVPHKVDEDEDPEKSEFICKKNRSMDEFLLPMRYKSQFSRFEEGYSIQ